MTAIALDVGDRRIGVAVSDPTELVARPLTVLRRSSYRVDVPALQRIVEETGATTIVVGLPISLNDTVGPQAAKTLEYVDGLKRRLAIAIVTWDERMTTEAAEDLMIAQGWSRKRRQEMIDAAAAAVILQEYLDAHRPKGQSVT